jgi:exosome complex exonuclease RRP6
MLLYARIDTHYLLEIYDRMRADIFKRSVDNNMDYVQNLKSVFNISDERVASIQYEGTNFRKTRYYEDLKERFVALQPPNKVELLDRIFDIRDAIAKEEDFKADDIFPNKYIFELVDKKKFDFTTVSHCLRKSPELLHKYFGRISRELEELAQRQTDTKMEEE